MMKLITIIALFVLSTTLQAQSYLSVIGGTDVANIIADKKDPSFYVRDDTFSHKSLLLGLRYDYTLSKKLFISVSSTVSKYRVNTYDFSFNPIKEMDFYQIKNSLNFNYSILENLYAGIGSTYSYIPGINTLNILNNTDYRTYNKHQISFNIVTGFMYKHFLLELSYIKGIKNLYEDNYFRPIDNLGVNAGFMFKLPRVFKKKAVDCPRF